MNVGASSKGCLACAEPIQVRAKRCPHCHQPQDRLVLFLQSGGFVLLLIVAVLAFMVYQFRRETHEFKAYASQVSLGDFVVHVEGEGVAAHASCVTQAKNGSDFGWRDLQLEARYYDAGGRLIDVGHERLARALLPEQGEATLRVLDRAARAASEYSRCELVIQDAASR